MTFVAPPPAPARDPSDQTPRGHAQTGHAQTEQPLTDRSGSDLTLSSEEVLRIRNDFPVLHQLVNGHPLAYLDSGATSQNPISVMEAEQEYYEQRNAAVHRGAHTLAFAATEVFEAARATVAAFVGAAENEIVWTSNATEGVNLVSYAFSNASLGLGGPAASRFVLGTGDEIVVTEMEHHSNLIPWQQLALRTGATLRFIPVLADGTLDMTAAGEILNPRTRLLAVTHASNVVGTINPIDDLVAMAHAVDALVFLDACQSAPHLALNLTALDVDFAVFSGHKMLGPTGIGVLYGKAELLAAMPPFLTGGSMITTVDMQTAEFLAPPQRFEAGTQRISQAIALASAVDYLSHTGMGRIRTREAELGRRLVEGVTAIPGVRLLGPGLGVERIGLAAVDVAGVHAHDVGQFLDEAGIAVRVGHHCAQPLHKKLGVTASTRASTYLYTTDDEVDRFLAVLAEVGPFFGVPR